MCLDAFRAAPVAAHTHDTGPRTAEVGNCVFRRGPERHEADNYPGGTDIYQRVSAWLTSQGWTVRRGCIGEGAPG